MLEAIETAEQNAAASSHDAEENPMSRDLALPALPVHYVQALNAFYRRRASLQFRFAGRGVRLAPTWLADDPEIAEPYTITFKVDGDQAELVISASMLNFLLLQLDPGLSLERLDPEQAALIVEHALTEPLTFMEQSIGCQLAVITVSKGAGKWTGPDRPNLPLVLYVERMGIAWSMLRLAAGDIVRLCGFFDRSAGPARGALDIPLPLRVRVAAAAMSLAEIHSIEPGDILLPDDLARQPDGGVAVIGEHLVAPVEITPAGYRLGARIRRGRGSPLEWSLNPQTPPHAGTADGAIGDVPVRVMFEAGMLDFDLRNVQKLAPGTVVPLARAASDGLDITVNGRRIGRGRLVRIGDATGVRVTRLFGRSV
jgi:type III secretion protein Q